MIRSMTGFATQSREIVGVQYTVEIRTLNSRYYKSIIRLPDVWSHLELEIDRRLRNRLSRGSVQLTLKMKSISPETTSKVNIPLLEHYVEQLDIIRPDQSDLNLNIDLATLLLLPGVCTPPGSEELSEIVPELIDLIEDTITAVIDMRTKEGKTIAKDLIHQCQVIREHLDKINQRAGIVVKEHYEKLKQKVCELTALTESEITQQDIAREAALLAERCDISEEISRLTCHIDQFLTIAENEDQPGRKLDFLSQEMLREANTIASKANDTEIIQLVVEIKTAIDRIREQVQNVE